MRLSPVLLAAMLPAAVTLASGMTTVSQKNRAFGVHDVQIARGDTIHFTNDDEFTHQIYVESPSLKYESDEQDPGQTVDVRFPATGTFEVRCHIHPRMLLHVDVR